MVVVVEPLLRKSWFDSQEETPVKWKWQNAFLTDIFLITNLYVLKLWQTLIKEFGGSYWLKIKIKKERTVFIDLVALCGSSNCDKVWLTFCVATITMPTSFHQCLSVKPCFETKFCQKFPYKIYFSVVWKVVAQSTTFVIYCG